MQVNHQPKEVVRRYTQQRAQTKSPPPTPEQIRRELGWHLLPNSGRMPEGMK